MKIILSLMVVVLGTVALLVAQTIDADVRLISKQKIVAEGTRYACHAGTLVETTPGAFMAAWFAGSREGANDVKIWNSTYKKGHWSTPHEIVSGVDSIGNPLPCWNPVLFKTRKHSLFLFYKVGKNPREWWGMMMQSSDLGQSWNSPHALPHGFLGPIKNKPLQLSNGAILCPSSTECADGEWNVHVEMTDDACATWKKVHVKADTGVGVIQPTIIQHPNGKLQMLCRSRHNRIFQAWSDDSGLHWSRLSATTLPNPNAGIDAIALNNGLYALVYNPLERGRDWSDGRNVLCVAISKDGEHWNNVYQLEHEREGEFSYPAILQATDQSLHIVYTAKRSTINHVVLQVKEQARH